MALSHVLVIYALVFICPLRQKALSLKRFDNSLFSMIVVSCIHVIKQIILDHLWV